MNNTQYKIDGRCVSKEDYIKYLKECAAHWRSEAVCYPHSKAKPDQGCLQQAEMVEKMADTILRHEMP